MSSEKLCEHDLAERETACADGMCPVCLADALEAAEALNKREPGTPLWRWEKFAEMYPESSVPALYNGAQILEKLKKYSIRSLIFWKLLYLEHLMRISERK